MFTAAGRIDYREDVADRLGIPAADMAGLADGDILLRAYERLGPRCAEFLEGDWSFAARHPAEKELFIARDRSGNTSLYYRAGPRGIVFAPCLQALLSPVSGNWSAEVPSYRVRNRASIGIMFMLNSPGRPSRGNRYLCPQDHTCKRS
ncbi:MAG: hypothetical protein HY816_03770 [Candidatus Wallbacteria bacterium]|nr:hypothetical protein [Candidatus Wallbacteria bacterium]